MFNNGCKGPHLLRSTHESSPNLLATSCSKVSGRYMLKHGHITHENRPTPILIIPPNFIMNDLLFRKRHALVMQYLTNNVAVAMICLTTCLSGHLEWWECQKIYKMHSISHMEPKVQLFFWHLEPENAWFDNEAIIHMQRFTTQFVRKKIIHS